MVYYILIMVGEEVARIREWLGSGAVNIFGLPMSGKDTLGTRLAETLGAKLLGSGDILRQREAETGEDLTKNGDLTSQDKFREIVLPYFYRGEFAGVPLVLSMIGRWSGEEEDTMDALVKSGHPTRAVLLMDVSEADVRARWEAARILDDRGVRADDVDGATFDRRLAEFREKVAPVIMHYERLGLLVHVRADGTRDETFARAIEGLLKKSREG